MHAVGVLLLAPVALTATALNAGIETAGSTFLPLYAISLGWTETGATLLISTLMPGAVLLPLVAALACAAFAVFALRRGRSA